MPVDTERRRVGPGAKPKRSTDSQGTSGADEETLVLPVHAPQCTNVLTGVVGDEGLDRITYYSVKREVLGKSAEQVVANTVANPTRSETVALLIERWDGLDGGVKAEIADLLSHD